MHIIWLNGHSLTIEDIVRVARNGYGVALDPSARAFVPRGSSMVEKWADAGETIYGITTGFGDLASTSISPELSEKLQENLLKSHSCGVGEPFPEEIVRAAMLLRINTLTRGYSGIRLKTLDQMVAYLNEGIHPVIPSQGSVGSSGDLCPLSHLAITLLGLGEVFYRGRRVPTLRALKEAGLKPLDGLGPKEGLALNNGTAMTTAVSALSLYDALELAKAVDVAAALSLEALHGVPDAFDPRIHELRPHIGQKLVASNIRRLIEGSEIVEAYRDKRVQDAYSLRCIPQVHGASRDAMDFVRQKIEIEINSVTDNPLIFPAEGEVLSGGNFHAQPIALAMDFLGIAVAELADISERRVARLVDHKLSGLPRFLIKNSGLNSGLMIPQYTCAALVSENKVLAHPASVDSIPTSANQEDHVSMGAYAARKARTIVENAQKVAAIEFLVAAQALDFSAPLKPGKGTGAAYRRIRDEVPFLEEDVILYPLIDVVLKLLCSGEVVAFAEGVIGELD
ncbi:histidine ammonia-lyase [Acetomicrobium sp. S15 = DSM 107314]|uniref:histidine ammonia-lyase n=1 Tax=Acetomicrobium sp. S15 = DSM 107314 TaxID=2529858 RepID=UPI0018E191D7|nr:histidine ammonia-lyase [Acetomicrobium sp. S15 = DSM 107314]